MPRCDDYFKMTSILNGALAGRAKGSLLITTTAVASVLCAVSSGQRAQAQQTGPTIVSATVIAESLPVGFRVSAVAVEYSDRLDVGSAALPTPNLLGGRDTGTRVEDRPGRTHGHESVHERRTGPVEPGEARQIRDSRALPHRSQRRRKLLPSKLHPAQPAECVHGPSGRARQDQERDYCGERGRDHQQPCGAPNRGRLLGARLRGSERRVVGLPPVHACRRQERIVQWKVPAGLCAARSRQLRHGQPVAGRWRKHGRAVRAAGTPGESAGVHRRAAAQGRRDGTGWTAPEMQDALANLVKHAIATLPIDPDRVYLIGLSMGSNGGWTLLRQHRNLFAASLQTAGYRVAEADVLANLRDFPMWVSHGTDDKLTPYDADGAPLRAMKALQAAGTPVVFGEWAANLPVAEANARASALARRSTQVEGASPVHDLHRRHEPGVRARVVDSDVRDARDRRLAVQPCSRQGTGRLRKTFALVPCALGHVTAEQSADAAGTKPTAGT